MLIFTEVILVFFVLGSVYAGEIAVKKDVRIEGDQVFLKDVLDGKIAGDSKVKRCEALRLWSAPSPGKKTTFECGTLERLIRNRCSALKGKKLDCSGRITITRLGKVISGKSMKAMVKRYLVDQRGMNEGDFKLKLADSGKKVLIPSESRALSVERISGNPQSGHISAIFVYYDGRTRRQFSISFKMEIYGEVAILRRRIQQGEVITERDVDFKTLNVNELRCQPVLRGASFNRMKARRTLSNGEPMCWQHFKFEKLVKRGDVVTILVEHGGLRITGRGLALDEGGRGKVIRVRNVDSKRIVYGQVTDSSEVRINF